VIGREVAIKVLHTKWSDDPDAVRRFVAEARAVNAVRHPNIVDVIDVGTLDDGRHYHVMERLRGVSQRSRLELLRVLQAGEVMPIGTDRPVRVDVRLVTATLRDLEADVTRATFRSDLLGRLLGPRVTLQPLRERKEDLAPLVMALLARNHQRELSFTPDAVRALYAHDWPRNIRELERALDTACALTSPPSRASSARTARRFAAGCAAST